MASAKEVKENTLAVVDSAIAILDKLPSLDDASTGLSVNVSTNPFEFLMDLFKHTSGYNTLIKILSTYITFELPALEIAVKGVLLTNLKNILTCSINPILSTELLQDGIVFDLKSVDITDKLQYSPLSEKGKYYYFGCDDCEIADDTKNSKDFDALLWFMKTRAVNREVWGRTSEVGEREGADDYQKKEDGVVTLEYHERSSALLNAEGTGLNQQTPYNDCLHVFIGNTRKAYSGSMEASQRNFDNIQTVILYAKGLKERLTAMEDEYNTIRQQNVEKFNNQQISELMYAYYESTCQRVLSSLSYLLYDALDDETTDGWTTDAVEAELKRIDDLYTTIENVTTDDVKAQYRTVAYLTRVCTDLKTELQLLLYDTIHDGDQYRDVKHNYYYRHTLMEFNYDFITSVKLFDAKVIAAQLLDQLIGLLSIDLGLSYKQLVVKNEVKKMVQMVVETDDTVVSDCFFSFSNEEYDSMLQKAELTKAGLFTTDGEETSTTQIDAQSILDSLNGISDDATQETMQTIISGALTDISKEITDEEYEKSGKVNFGVQMNFIEKLMTNLAYVITMSVLSPKLYLLLLVNLELLGRSTNYTIEGFINQFKQLIVSLIREIRDQLITYLVNELMKIVVNLAKNIAAEITIEQAAYYARLMKKIIECFRRHKGPVDWEMDAVGYADIYGDDFDYPDRSTTKVECG